MLDTTIQGEMRRLLDLIEGKSGNRSANAGGWGVAYSPLFNAALVEKLRSFPDLEDKIDKFEAVKKENPLASKYGKHDRPMTGDFVGLWHCHLRDDAILIYRLADRKLRLVYIASHAELEGKRQKATVARLRSAGEL